MTISLQQILHALEAVAGKNTLFLAKNELDPKLEAIAGSWPALFDVTLAPRLGLVADGTLTQTVRDLC
jgi:hypothetical protein